MFLVFQKSYSQKQDLNGTPSSPDFWGIHLGVGPGLSNIQELKTSGVIFSGISSNYHIGFGKISDQSIFDFDIYLATGNVKAQTNEIASESKFNAGFDVSYLRRIVPQSKLKWHLGPVLSLQGIFTNNSQLGNNSGYLLYNNTLSLKGRVEKKINDRISVAYSLSTGVIGLVYERQSFAFSAPQELLESGEFTNKKGEELGVYKYSKIASFGKYYNIRSGVSFNMDRKKSLWRIGYEWGLVRYKQIRDGAITSGDHNVTLTYIFKL